MQDRRDWIILMQGREQAQNVSKADIIQNICLLIPELGRLARIMAAEDTVDPEDMWRDMGGLYMLCTRDLTVLYLPGLAPVNGECPVKCCWLGLDR